MSLDIMRYHHVNGSLCVRYLNASDESYHTVHKIIIYLSMLAARLCPDKVGLTVIFCNKKPLITLIKTALEQPDLNGQCGRTPRDIVTARIVKIVPNVQGKNLFAYCLNDDQCFFFHVRHKIRLSHCFVALSLLLMLKKKNWQTIINCFFWYHTLECPECNLVHS